MRSLLLIAAAVAAAEETFGLTAEELQAAMKSPRTKVDMTKVDRSFMEHDIQMPKGARAGHSNSAQYWPEGKIYYEINGFNTKERQYAAKAIANLSQNLCVEFIPRTANQQNYVSLQKGGGGCYSSVGYNPNGAAILVMADPCMGEWIIAHELFHTGGFLHTHLRPDRDNYITVNMQNLMPGMWTHDWTKCTDCPVPKARYNCNAMLHYSETAGAKAGTKVIVKDKCDSRDFLPTDNYLTESDIDTWNEIYCPLMGRQPPNGGSIGSGGGSTGGGSTGGGSTGGGGSVVTTSTTTTTTVASGDCYSLVGHVSQQQCNTCLTGYQFWPCNDTTSCSSGCKNGGGGGGAVSPSSTTTTTTTTTTSRASASCSHVNTDSDTNCNYWKTAGYCQASSSYYSYMADACKKSCLCGDAGCAYSDSAEHCAYWKEQGFCAAGNDFSSYMNENCANSCLC